MGGEALDQPASRATRISLRPTPEPVSANPAPVAPGDMIELDFDLPVTPRRDRPNVRWHRGKVAVTRSPLVYCLESVDNPGVDVFKVCFDPTSLHVEPASDLLVRIRIIRGQTTTGKPLTLTPNCL